MLWVRRFFVGILAIALLVSLLLTATLTSAEVNFNNAQKITNTIESSHLYTDLVNNLVNEASQGILTSGSLPASLTTQFQQAVETSYTSQQFDQDVYIVISSNLNWLNGKTNVPSFTIDLTGVKQALAIKLGAVAQNYVESLPVCSAAEAANANVTNPLTLTCRPSNLQPSAVATQVSTDISSSQNVLSTAVINPSTINVKGNGGGQAYYQQFSSLPSVYKWIVRLPILFAILCLIWCLGIIFISSKKRKGFRTISVILILAGLILLSEKFAEQKAINTINRHINNNQSIAVYESSLFNLVHTLVTLFSKIDNEFAAGYIVLALIIIVVQLFQRRKGKSAPKPVPQSAPAQPSPSPVFNGPPLHDASEVKLAPPRRTHESNKPVSVNSNISGPRPMKVPVFSDVSSNPTTAKKRPPKKPKLIQ